MQAEVHSAVAEGDEVAVRATMHLTHVGTFLSSDPTGKRVSGRETAFFRLEGGKIAEVWAMEDLQGIAVQPEG